MKLLKRAVYKAPNPVPGFDPLMAEDLAKELHSGGKAGVKTLNFHLSNYVGRDRVANIKVIMPCCNGEHSMALTHAGALFGHTIGPEGDDIYCRSCGSLKPVIVILCPKHTRPQLFELFKTNRDAYAVGYFLHMNRHKDITYVEYKGRHEKLCSICQYELGTKDSVCLDNEVDGRLLRADEEPIEVNRVRGDVRCDGIEERIADYSAIFGRGRGAI